MYSPVPSRRGGSSSRGGLVEFVEILKKGWSFLGQPVIKFEPNKVKWVVKFVQKWNLTLPYNYLRDSRMFI